MINKQIQQLYKMELNKVKDGPDGLFIRAENMPTDP
jgi:hypothetical protein